MTVSIRVCFILVRGLKRYRVLRRLGHAFIPRTMKVLVVYYMGLLLIAFSPHINRTHCNSSNCDSFLYVFASAQCIPPSCLSRPLSNHRVDIVCSVQGSVSRLSNLNVIIMLRSQISLFRLLRAPRVWATVIRLTMCFPRLSNMFQCANNITYWHSYARDNGPCEIVAASKVKYLFLTTTLSFSYLLQQPPLVFKIYIRNQCRHPQGP